MDCLTLCADGKTRYMVKLTHILDGQFTYCPLDIFETERVINFSKEWNVTLKYNERIDATVRTISFITTKDFYQLLSEFGDDYDISYKQLPKGE